MPETNCRDETWKYLLSSIASVLLACVSTLHGQEPLPQLPPTNLAEALFRLQMLNTGPNRQKQSQPNEFFAEFPKNALITLESCRAAADYSAKADGRALVVIVDNQPGYERYEPTWHRWKSHRLGNVSECFAGVVAAIAVQDGLLEFDEPVSKTITEWADGSKRAEITVRQLLSLTSGIEAGDIDAVETYKTSIQAPLTNDPGKTFSYGPNAFQVFGELVCRKLAEKNGQYKPSGYVDFLKESICKPLKIEIEFWVETLDKEANVSTGAFLNAVDLAKFGALLCNGGTWDGQELIKTELLQEILKGSEANPQYGMGFWLVPENQPSETTSDTAMIMPTFGRTRIDGMYIAAGNGKQRLYVLPNEKIVIVRIGDPRVNLFRDEAFFRHLLAKQNAP
jgi:CubicO group peptidase (beta-lactamase class C family)